MKKNALTIYLLIILPTVVFGQLHISTDLREDFDWDSTQQKWIFISKDETSSTLFAFNKAVTLFKHTTPTITSTYYIRDSSMTKDDLRRFEIVSDVGNNYTMFIDAKNNNVRFIGQKKEGLFLVRHKIKRLWYDE
jgi:hypothetical protein